MNTKKSIMVKYLRYLVPYKKGQFLLPITYTELNHYLKSVCVEDLPLIYINGGGFNENPIKYGLIKSEKSFMIWKVGTGPLATFMFTTLNLKTKVTKQGLSVNWHVRNNLFGNFIALISFTVFLAGIINLFYSNITTIDIILPIGGFVLVVMFAGLFNSDANENIEFLETIQKKFANIP